MRYRNGFLSCSLSLKMMDVIENGRLADATFYLHKENIKLLGVYFYVCDCRPYNTYFKSFYCI